MVLGIEPADYDIATSAHPEQVVRIFPRTALIGAQFGVVLVIHRGHPFEVATFRSDDAYVDGRRPTGVTFTDARQDVLRRDFTINGLLYDPVADTIIDYISGRDDISAKLVRAIGDPHQRFKEDKLRMLRAIRFGARLGYTVEPETWKAILEMAPDIHQVSNERIREELVRILTEGQAVRGMQMVHDSGLRQELLPELEWTGHLKTCLNLLRKGAPEDFAIAVLLHETPIDRIIEIVERLKFSRAEINHVVVLAENLPQFADIHTMSTSTLKRFFRMPRFEDHLELARIHSTANNDLRDFDFARLKYLSWSQSEIAPPALISGEDLIGMGFVPGPVFREILTRIEDEQLEGRLSKRDQALSFVREHYGKSKSS